MPLPIRPTHRLILSTSPSDRYQCIFNQIRDDTREIYQVIAETRVPIEMGSEFTITPDAGQTVYVVATQIIRVNRPGSSVPSHIEFKATRRPS